MANAVITYDTAIDQTVHLPLSKSVVNRSLMLQAYAHQVPTLEFTPDIPNDIRIVYNTITTALQSPQWNVEDSGTAMRFLLSYAAFLNKNRTIFGTERMHKRPIKPLVDALQKLGYHITYLEKEGFPPVSVHSTKHIPSSDIVHIDGQQSSQFTTSLLLLGAFRENGLRIHTTNQSSSAYIQLTIDVLKQYGIDVIEDNETFHVKPFKGYLNDVIPERDSSAACYFLSALSVAKKGHIVLKNIQSNSSQPDSRCFSIYRHLGVRSEQKGQDVHLSYDASLFKPEEHIDFSNIPDQAMTIMASYATLGIALQGSGIHTLQLKESKRIDAMKTELEKLRCTLHYYPEKDSFTLLPTNHIPPTLQIKTYGDHRMAMSFAVLAPAFQQIILDDMHVVQKSFPGFFDELKKIGYVIQA